MRTVHYLTVAIGFAALVGVVPASLAKDSIILDRCKPAGTGTEAEESQTKPMPGGNGGVSVALPIGSVCVGPESVDGAASYVRRKTEKEGMAVVEVSSTPFMPDLPAGAAELIVARADQPASW